mgnify:CR=1 FL=1
MSQTCYMCDNTATSTEHAPPKCFFPEQSVVGKDLRRNLVTVPSCDAHNSLKSKDDEYLRFVILLASGTQSAVAKTHFFDKVLRAVTRRPYSHSAFVEPLGLRLDVGEICAIDLPRFNRGMEALGAALHLHEFGAKLQSPVRVISPNLFVREDDRVKVPSVHEQAIATTREFLASAPIRGDNGEVFMYRARRDEASGSFAFAAVFYEAFEVFGASVVE